MRLNITPVIFVISTAISFALSSCVFNKKDIITVDSTKMKCVNEEDYTSRFCLQVATPEIIFNFEDLNPASLITNHKFLELVLVSNYMDIPDIENHNAYKHLNAFKRQFFFHTSHSDSNSGYGDFTIYNYNMSHGDWELAGSRRISHEFNRRIFSTTLGFFADENEFASWSLNIYTKDRVIKYPETLHIIYGDE